MKLLREDGVLDRGDAKHEFRAHVYNGRLMYVYWVFDQDANKWLLLESRWIELDVARRALQAADNPLLRAM